MAASATTRASETLRSRPRTAGPDLGSAIDYVPADEFEELEYQPDELEFARRLTTDVAGGAEAESASSVGPLLARSLPPLTAEEERVLFRRMNFVKFQAEAIRSTMSQSRPSRRKAAKVTALLEEADAVRRRIVESNLRLVATVCRKYSRNDQEFQEFVSEGLLILLAAIRKFDYSRGFRFSTYAYNAVQRELFRTSRRASRRNQRFVLTPDEVLSEVSESAGVKGGPEVDHAAIYESLMEAASGRLTDREESIVRRRFGTDKSGVTETLRDIAADLGLSKERVRQIQITALQKLQRIATELNLSASSI